MLLRPTQPPNADQQRVIDRLDRLGTALLDGETPRGIYLHGAVGRGKTWLCDQFFEQLPTESKRRVHFHGFFRQLHREIWNLRLASPADAELAVEQAVASLLEGSSLLCFDEFHVHDPGDASLALRVLDEVLASGVTLLATSNYAPHDLLPGPFHHVFQRGIDLIADTLEVVELGGDRDYRRTTRDRVPSGFAAGTWFRAEGTAQLSAAGLRWPSASERRQLTVSGHQFTARRAAGRQLWFTFDELLERTSAVADYLHWATTYDVWVIDGVPKLSDASPQAAKRFGNLVDVLCDRGATLHIVSEHPRDAVFDGGRLPLDSARTASRLALLQNPTGVQTQS
jgi:cell division protein ZapE